MGTLRKLISDGWYHKCTHPLASWLAQFFRTNSSQQWQREGDSLRGEGGEHSGHEPGVDDGGGDGPGPEQHLVALRLHLGQGGGDDHRAGDEAGGGPDQGVGQGAGDPVDLSDLSQHGVHQSGQQLRVTSEQPEGAGHQGGAGPHHRAG